MTDEMIRQRIKESEETLNVCQMCGNEAGAKMAQDRLRTLREKLTGGPEAIEKRKEIETMTGCCRFCGQYITVEADPDTPEAMLNELATRKCKCEGAEIYAWKLSTLEVFGQDLETVFGDDKQDIKEMLMAAGKMIVNGKIMSIRVKQEEGKTLGLKMKKKGLCITVEQKSTMENISYG